MSTEAKQLAADARKRADEADEQVRYLRRLLGQAMREQAEAQAAAREAERNAT